MIDEWTSFCKQVKEFHDDQCDRHGRSGSGKDEGWKQSDTAKHFEVSVGLICENLKLAEALESGVINSNMTRQEALELLNIQDVKFFLYGAKYLGKSALYKREDTLVPYLFVTRIAAKSFCDRIVDFKLEPVKIEFKMKKGK